MADEKNPFESVQAMMLENLEKMQGATQSYIDMVGKAMQGFPGADENRIANFKAYLERQVAANRDFLEKLLRAKDFQDLPHSSRILSVSTEGGRGRRKGIRHQNSELVRPSNNRVSVGAFSRTAAPDFAAGSTRSRMTLSGY